MTIVDTYAFQYPDLPIMARRDDILKALREHPAIVVQGGTGSGKTTQLPKFLLEAGFAASGLIGVTQPRRIAALSITDRLRQETGSANLIGAKIRFHEDLPSGARIKVMTDGILLQEFRRDPLMRQYSCVILDEAHERSLNVDILLGIFKTLLPRRPDFRLVVTSATLDANRFAAFLGTEKNPAPVVEVEGRQFPVSLEYWDISGKDQDDEDENGQPARAFPPMEAAAIAIRELQARRPDNLLAFLPTEKEIHELHRELERDLGKTFSILPLYGRLGPADQKKVFEESSRPKIILATNIAETSLTIPGIGYVVDMGLARISRYHPHTKIQGLPIERISQASARQRAGRAGRVKPGVCVRLYAESDFKERPEYTEPEILRSNLANVVLQLLALGLPVGTFPFPDPPTPAALKGAFRQLHELGGVTSPDLDGLLTQEGLKLSRLPVDVAIGKILLTASDLGALQPALILAAGITVQDPRFTPREEPEKGKATGLHRRFDDPRSDFLGVIALWIWIHRNWGESYSQRRLRALCVDNFLSFNRVREWIELTEQFCRLLKVTLDPAALKAEAIEADAFHKSILAGFMPFLARRKPEDVSYRLAGDKEAFLHPGSGLVKRKPEWIVAGEVRQTSRVYIFRACEIKPAWIEELAPDACKRSYLNIAWNGERGFVEALERVTYKGFAIRQDRRVNYESVAPEDCAEMFWREGVIRDGSGAPFPFRDRNLGVIESLTAMERKVRTRGLVPDEDTLAHWYRQRAPEVTSRIRLERFIKENGASKLEFSPEEWSAPLSAGDWNAWLPGGGRMGGGTAGGASTVGSSKHPLAALFPETVEAGGLRYRVSYRFDFGDALDGISVETDPEGLAGLSLQSLARGIPGWRKWIWEFFLDRIGAKAAQAARSLSGEIAAAWDLEMALPPQGALSSQGAEAGLPFPSPAAALAKVLASAFADAKIEIPGSGLVFPATWPSHTQIHVFATSPNGRRFLVHVDPAFGDSEMFSAVRRILYGDAAASHRPWPEWAASTLQNFGSIPAALPWRGLHFGADPLGLTGAPAVKDPSTAGFFRDAEEAAFHRRLAASLASASASTSALKTPVVDAKSRAALSALFARRFQVLMDAWGCPERVRKETEKLRELVCSVWLPAWYLEAHGADAQSHAERDLPQPRAAPAKPGVQVKSLAALSQAVSRGNESGSWAGVALCMGAALVSRRCFLNWFRSFAQPPSQAKTLLEDLLRETTATPEGLEMLSSPFYAAWIAKAWEARLPESILRGSEETAMHPDENPGTLDLLPEGGWPEARGRWDAGREKAEQVRKGAKGVRDRFCNRVASLGQNVGGLPQDLRESLAVLDKPVPWPQKSLAELELELYLNRTKGRAGAAGSEAKPGNVNEERKGQLLKDLSARNRKL
jgi:HrpA-like RNA helicase